MPIKGNILYPFRWFWRQSIATQIQLPSPNPPPVPQPLTSASSPKKRQTP
jgi:hypothetical protein